MKCYIHNIEHGYGNCPQCEQERHNKQVEGLMKKQSDMLERQQRQSELQWQIEHDFQRAQFQAAQQENLRQAQEGVKNFLFELFPIIQKHFGNEFLAKYYLRFVIFPRESLKFNLVEDYILDCLSFEMTDEDKNLILLQQELLEKVKLEENKELQRRGILCDESDKKYKERQIEHGLLGGIGGLLIGVLLGMLVGGFFWIGVLIFPLLGLAVASSTSLDEDGNDKLLQELKKSEEFAKKFNWYQHELMESNNFYKSIEKGMPFVQLKLTEWNDEKISAEEIIIKVQADLKL